MSRDDAASWQHPLDDAPDQATDSSADAGGAFGGGVWGDGSGEAADPTATNLFSAEIENVNASDWDIDADSIWGDDGEADVDDGGAIGLDFPL
jgi:hypothetical protein